MLITLLVYFYSGGINSVVPIVRMTGITMKGNSVCAHVFGFYPYIYIPAPSDSFTPTNCSDFMRVLDSALQSDGRSSRESLNKYVLAVDPVQRCSMYGFRYNKLYPFLKITLALPKLVAAARRILENGITVPGFNYQSCSAYESNVEYEIRYMIDQNIVGCNWIECPNGKYILHKPAQSRSVSSSGFTIFGSRSANAVSKCQIELSISYEDIISHEPEGEWQKIAPFRILSFDIECAGRKGVFPVPEVDSVIQIANMVVSQGDSEPFIRNVFTLNTCSPIVGSDVRSFDNEKDLLKVNKLTVTSLICVHACYYTVHAIYNERVLIGME